ncbi:fungal-specific transcription factor domain-containing protein [Flagelloscypha sp. PMI_526]|nr:fungal-specific transcription factor domain-containing protein [Flagelloscypha sp. PMI_526]
MPPGATALDKEEKRKRNALSLKLKCSKTSWPCESCVRRGCSAICPNGSLVTGQGTRFVLADTDKLHSKIAHMSDRIRQLEDALALLQSTQSEETHPLLATRELLMIKSSLELHSAVEGMEDPNSFPSLVKSEPPEETHTLDSFGTLAIHDDGASTFYGRSAGSEVHQVDVSCFSASVSQLPHAVLELANVFPFAGSRSAGGIDVEFLVRHCLPTFAEAKRLCWLYHSQAQFYFGPVNRRQLDEELLPLIYPEARSQPGDYPQPGPHDLALLYIIFCFGSLMDVELPFAPDNDLADRYSILCKATLNLEPIISRPPTCSTVQTLSLMAIYEGLCSGDNSIESTWALFGLSTKLAQSIGLHRDPERWKLSVFEVQKRRAFLWELFTTDCWQSLATGRLPTFALPFVDTEIPFDNDSTLGTDNTVEPSFVAWKACFGRDVLSQVVQGTLTSHAPKYSMILKLDRLIRDFSIPQYAQGSPPQGKDLAGTMRFFMIHNYVQLTLVYIHRVYFAQAISTHSHDPIKSPYAPSFLAGYRSACNLLGYLNMQFQMFPAQISRLWVLWTHGFSASVMLSSVVTHATASKVAFAALLELRKACELFTRASSHGGRSVKFLPIIKRLLDKANQSYMAAARGSGSQTRQENDELSVFSGKTTLKRMPRMPSEPPGSLSPSASTDSNSSGGSQVNKAFTEAHPSLVNELQGFDSQLNAQIQGSHQQWQYSEQQPQHHDTSHYSPPSTHQHHPHEMAPPLQHQVTQYQSNSTAHAHAPAPNFQAGSSRHSSGRPRSGSNRIPPDYGPPPPLERAQPSHPMYQGSGNSPVDGRFHYPNFPPQPQPPPSQQSPPTDARAWNNHNPNILYPHEQPRADDRQLQETWQHYMTNNVSLVLYTENSNE